MTQELKNDLIASWNDVEEVCTNFATLHDSDLLFCRQSIVERLERVKYLLGKYVNEKDIIEQI